MKALQPHIRRTIGPSGRSLAAPRDLFARPQAIGRQVRERTTHATKHRCTPVSTRASSLSPKRPIGSTRTLGHSRSSCLPFMPSAVGKACYSNAMALPGQPIIQEVFEAQTGTWQYVVADPSTLHAVIIDPVLDYDRQTQVLSTVSADKLLSLVKDNGYHITRILETHAHADHLTAASYLQHTLAIVQGCKPAVGIGKRIDKVQTLFGQRYGVPEDERQGAFDKLFEDDETFKIGELEATAIHLPGHTPDHLGYKIGDNVFCGDSLFHVDIGTARCDFPGGSASDLFQSGRRLLSLPDHVKIWTGHDYPPDGRAVPVPWMTVQDHRAQNKHLKDGITEEEFVAQRKQRDTNLGEPKLLHQSLQTNIRAGKLPKPTASGHRMLRLPLKLAHSGW